MNGSRITVAAVGDLHCDRHNSEPVKELLTGAADRADVVLLAGDLTTHGEPAEASVLAGHLTELRTPVVAVLGNHDWHAGLGHAVAETLRGAGATVLERDHAILRINDTELGIAGAKGFIGGFTGSHLTDFGEPLLREVYAEGTAEAGALDRSLQEIATCPFRIVLLHYSPAEGTLQGEGPGIYLMLGSDRLAGPIREHEPTAVFHGHAHSGSPRATIGEVPIFNVSLPVREGQFFLYELNPEDSAAGAIH